MIWIERVGEVAREDERVSERGGRIRMSWERWRVEKGEWKKLREKMRRRKKWERNWERERKKKSWE